VDQRDFLRAIYLMTHTLHHDFPGIFQRSKELTGRFQELADLQKKYPQNIWPLPGVFPDYGILGTTDLAIH